MRVLVLDGNENQAVASVRSLARAGHVVEVGASTAWSKAGWSRHASASFRYAAPERDARAFVDDVARAAGRVPGTLVMPMTERTTLPLSGFRDRLLDAGGRVVLPSHETVLEAFDKARTTALAASLGVAVPETEELAGPEQVRAFAGRARFPVVLKARASEELDAEGRTRATGAPRYARTAAELDLAWRDLAGRSTAVLAQEYVEGRGAGYFALMRHGEPRAEFAHRRIRDVRPSGSGSAVRESAAPDPAMREASLRILGALRWHGVAMVEYRVRADGTPVFMEVNGRFWNSLALAVHAGVDFPALVAGLAERGDVAPVLSYRAGVRCRWLLGDARHLAAVMAGRPPGYSGDWPGRLATLASVLVPVRGTRHDNFTLDDPLPEAGDWLDFLARRVPRSVGWRGLP